MRPCKLYGLNGAADYTDDNGLPVYYSRDDSSLTEEDVFKICNKLIGSVLHYKISEIVDAMIEERLKELIADMTEEEFDKFILEIRARRSLLPPKELIEQGPIVEHQ